MAVGVTSSAALVWWCLPGLGEDVEANVAAHLGSLVVLFGQDRAGHADQGIAAGEDPHDVGAAGISRLTRSYGLFLQIVRVRIWYGPVTCRSGGPAT